MFIACDAREGKKGRIYNLKIRVCKRYTAFYWMYTQPNQAKHL